MDERETQTYEAKGHRLQTLFLTAAQLVGALLRPRRRAPPLLLPTLINPITHGAAGLEVRRVASDHDLSKVWLQTL